MTNYPHRPHSGARKEPVYFSDNFGISDQY